MKILLSLPDKVLGIRSRCLKERIMKCVSINFLFHLKHQCAFTSQSFTVGHHFVNGVKTCERAPFL